MPAASTSVFPLDEFIRQAQLKNDLAEWRRGRAVRAYIDGRRVIEIAADCGVTRGSVNRWLQWYDADHVDGHRTTVAAAYDILDKF